ncbi:M56 family metallopeptidase [Arachidicoccus terrestris]|uniref:M56 family metallopeptidase n=1 Tax=Arachidicoccus terrestris TaxID=2875539 RepID=UPI001CC415C4|nr:M56 family metallopeptidase [Arachidicoccus terrestris]UAY57152.1 M48 family metalloprotease [Arachidicoccus terrestris]
MQTLFDWLSNPSFRSLALSLLASLWQAGLIFIVVYGLLRLNKNAPARIKYNIAAAGQLIIACWFIQTFLHHLATQATLSQSLTAHEAAMLFYPGEFPLLSGLYTEELGSGGFQLSKCLPLALCVYIIGVVIMTIRIIFAYKQTRVLKTRGIFAAPPSYIAHMQQVCGQLHIYNNVRLYLSDKVNVPVMMGFIKPVILLPVSILTHLTTAQIEAIITHELAHIRRQDYLVNFIQSVIEAVFFFNPFVWLLSKIMREEREKACDELVIREVSAYTYATALLALEKINGTKQLTLAANGHRSFKLLNRIKLFTMKQNPIMTVKQKALSLLLIVVGLGCIAWLSPDNAVQQKKEIKQITTQNTPELTGGTYNKEGIAKDSAPQSRHRTVIHRDSLSPEIQKQVDEITKSAQQIAQKFANDTSWKERSRAIQQKAQALALKFEQDPSWKEALDKITKDAKALSHKMQENPELKRQMRDLEKSAQDMAKDYKPSPEMQKQLEEIRNKSMAIALQFKNDTAWKKQLTEIRLKAREMAKQMKENPEMAQKIREMAERSKDMAFKVLNDPKFKAQLEKLKADIQQMKWMDEGSEK